MSFLANQGDPLNVTQTFPGKQDERYSPICDDVVSSVPAPHKAH